MPTSVADKAQAFHTETRLQSGHGLIVDIGSIGNLGGDEFARDVAACAMENGRRPSQTKRGRPLRVSGVGHGSDVATHNVSLPIAVKSVTGDCSAGTFDMPTVKNSKLPGLLGLNSLTSRRAVIDCATRKMYFLGPGDYDLAAGMPTGTQVFQLETAPSGHLVLPITHFKEFDRQQKHGNLTLDSVPLSLPVNVSSSSSSSL